MLIFFCFRIDTMVALEILAEAAKTNIAAMKILHSLARGVRPKVRGGSAPSTSRSDASGSGKHICENFRLFKMIWRRDK